LGEGGVVFFAAGGAGEVREVHRPKAKTSVPSEATVRFLK